MDFEFALEGEMLRSKFDPDLTGVHPSLPLDAVHLWADVFRSGKPVVFQDVHAGPDFPWRSHLLRQGVITLLIIPMFIAGEAAGVIGVRFLEKRQFRSEELDLAQALVIRPCS